MEIETTKTQKARKPYILIESLDFAKEASENFTSVYLKKVQEGYVACENQKIFIKD